MIDTTPSERLEFLARLRVAAEYREVKTFFIYLLTS